MNKELLDGIIERLQQDGPIDLYISEEEYEYLKLVMRSFWLGNSWTKEERLLTLAFFRGYTFYRELSEHDRAFWQNFHAELQVHQELPTANQYNDLWSAFKAHPDVQHLLQYDGRGRAFVGTVDEVWGIKSLRSQELINFFVTYYQKHPGKRITPTLIQQILPDVDETILRQAASYDRVFRSMTHAIDYILDNDLEGCAPDDLEPYLTTGGVDLGQPNALRFFTNKSNQAISTILGQLRLQRTPYQFQKYLHTVPEHLFLSPEGIRRRARALAQGPSLAYGRYEDLDTNEEHHITPAARISLNILENIPGRTYKDVAGLTTYLSPATFTAQVGNRVEASTPIFLQRGKHHLWAGRVQKGVSLCIDGQYHPNTKGWHADTSTQLIWGQNEAYLQGKILIDAFLPDYGSDLVVRVGRETFSVHPRGQGQHIAFKLSHGNVQATFEDFATWTWPEHDRLFTSSGREITRAHLKYGPKSLYLVSNERPQLGTSAAHAERMPGKLALWHITWSGESPLILDQWRIDEPYRSISYRVTPASHRHRDDIAIHFHPGFYQTGEAIEMQLDEELPAGTMLRVQGFTFIPYQGVIRIEALPPGRYAGEFICNGEIIAEIEPFHVLPPLSWELAQGKHLIQGHTQAGRITLPDGRFESFRWKPQVEEDGEPKRVPQSITLDEEMTVGFDIEARCFGAVFINPQTQQPLSVVRALHSNAISLKVLNPYYPREFPLRLRLASDPTATYSAQELPSLRPTSRDHLSVEACINRNSDTWVPVTRIAVHLKPVVSSFDVDQGYCLVKVAGPRDIVLYIEEFEPLSDLTVEQSVPVTVNVVERIKLCHPEKLRPIHVRMIVSTESTPEETTILEKLSPPLFDALTSLRHGLGWSSHSHPTR